MILNADWKEATDVQHQDTRACSSTAAYMYEDGVAVRV
jgi:hypothetical protein